MNSEKQSRTKIDVRVARLANFCKENPMVWLSFIREMPIEYAIGNIDEDKKAELMEQLQNAIKEYRYICDRKRKNTISEEKINILKEAGVGGALGYKKQIEDLAEKHQTAGLKGEKLKDEQYMKKHKKNLKKYLYTLDILYGGLDNFRKLYIQKLLNGERFDVPNEFEGLFIENFDLDSPNFVNPLYNQLYKDIRTLFKFEDESIIGEIYNGDKIKDAISMLDYRKQTIIRQRYGLDNNEESKYGELSARYNITEERTRQVKENAIMKLQMTTVYGRRLLACRDDEKRRQFITRYFENYDIFADTEQKISQTDREALLGIINHRSFTEQNVNKMKEEIPKQKQEGETEPTEEMTSNETNITTIKELGFNGRLYNALNRAGIKTTRDLENTSVRQFSRMRNIGEKTLEELLSKMSSLGIKTKDELSNTEIESSELKEKTIEALRPSTRLYNVLDRAGKTTIVDLSNTTVDEFLRIRDMGEKTFDELMTKMNSLGIKPKPVTETDEELLRTIQKLSNAYKENQKKGLECQELKQSIFELLDKIEKNNSNVAGSEHEGNDSYTNIEK